MACKYLIFFLPVALLKPANIHCQSFSSTTATHMFQKSEGAEFAMCGDCFCIPDQGKDTCPNALKPKTNFTDNEIALMQSQVARNPYSLNCNPYNDEVICQTTPPQNKTLVDLGDEAVCGVRYKEKDKGLDLSEHRGIPSGEAVPRCPSEYDLISYHSVQSALDDGSQITHAGGKSITCAWICTKCHKLNLRKKQLFFVHR